MKKLSNSELTTFCGQLALILRSGISSIEGLSIMIEDTPEGEGKKILEDLLHETEQTGSLYMALEASGCFPSYLCSMAEIGEQSGRLDDVMNSLSEHYRREEMLAKSIRSAVTYPLIMLGIMVTIILVLVIKVLPVFDQVYRQLGAGLTGFSRHFSAARQLSEKTACSRFASGMYLALSSGLDIDQSLDMVSRLVDHPVVSPRIDLIRQRLSEGVGFAEAAQEAEIFSGLYLRMIHIGFKTGAMDQVMKQISVQYDEEVQDQLDSLVSKVEPTLVAILSVTVGMVLLSVMLPLIGIMSNIG